MSPEEFSELVDESHEYLVSAQDACKRDFQIGDYERYDWNQDSGELVFSHEGIPRVIAGIQFVGSISTTSRTWLWSWDNATVVDSIKDQMQRVRDFGIRYGISKLTEAKWDADEVDGWEMTAIAARILKAKGAYRSPKDDGFTFMVFTDIRWADAE